MMVPFTERFVLEVKDAVDVDDDDDARFAVGILELPDLSVLSIFRIEKKKEKTTEYRN